jgi:hypothetical protein
VVVVVEGVLAVDPEVVVEVEELVVGEVVVVDELEVVPVVGADEEQPAITWSTSLGFGKAGVGLSSARAAPSVGTGSLAGISNGIAMPFGNSAVTHCCGTAVPVATVPVVLAEAAGIARPSRPMAVISVASGVRMRRWPVIGSVRLSASTGFPSASRRSSQNPPGPSRYLPPRRFATRNHIPAYCSACCAYVNANGGLWRTQPTRPYSSALTGLTRTVNLSLIHEV